MSHIRAAATSIPIAVCICLINLAALLTSGCSHTSGVFITEKDNQEKWGLRGEVKAYTLYTAIPLERLGRVFEVNSDPVYTHHFSSSGERVESIYYDALGNPVMNEKLTYDADKIVTSVIYKYNDDGSTTTETGGYTNVYNEDNNINYISGYYYHQQQDRVDWLHLYEYIDDGGKIVISSFHMTDPNFTVLQWKHIHKYRNGRLIEIEHYNANGSIEWIDKFTYDSKGNKTECAHFISHNRLEWIDTLKYDDNGNEIECTRRDSDGNLVHKYLYKYVLIPSVEIGDSSTIPDSLFFSKGYDPNHPGNTTGSFDRAGNWTVKVTLEENTDFGYTSLKVKEIQKREFFYYE